MAWCIQYLDDFYTVFPHEDVYIKNGLRRRVKRSPTGVKSLKMFMTSTMTYKNRTL